MVSFHGQLPTNLLRPDTFSYSSLGLLLAGMWILGAELLYCSPSYPESPGIYIVYFKMSAENDNSVSPCFHCLVNTQKKEIWGLTVNESTNTRKVWLRRPLATGKVHVFTQDSGRYCAAPGSVHLYSKTWTGHFVVRLRVWSSTQGSQVTHHGSCYSLVHSFVY